MVRLGATRVHLNSGTYPNPGPQAPPAHQRPSPAARAARGQVRDQTLTKGNLGLAANQRTRTPVRVLRGVNSAGAFGYIYEGARYFHLI